MADSDFFQVSIPTALRAKIERMARGSLRSMSNVVTALIEKADDTAPEWNIRPQEEPKPDDNH